jgi:hypothetical protein
MAHKDVLGLQIPVHDATAVQVRKRVCKLDAPCHDEVDGEAFPPTTSDDAPEVGAVDVLKDFVELGSVMALVDAALHAGVVQGSDNGDLPPVASERGTVTQKPGVGTLEDNGAVGPGIDGPKGLGPRAAAQQLLDGVVIDTVAGAVAWQRRSRAGSRGRDGRRSERLCLAPSKGTSRPVCSGRPRSLLHPRLPAGNR